jgi:hypothetical protein
MRNVRIGRITAALSVGVAVGVLVSASGPQADPNQSIAFSHRIHAGENQIPCLYCHTNARRSSVAGIPSVQRCMGCHKITAANKPGVQKLKEYWDRKEPIPWQKVTWMPDFVFFVHWPHVRGGIQCQTCHGPVETMDQMRPNTALTMDFCVGCHRQKKASIDCAVCHR